MRPTDKFFVVKFFVSRRAKGTFKMEIIGVQFRLMRNFQLLKLFLIYVISDWTAIPRSSSKLTTLRCRIEAFTVEFALLGLAMAFR
jgi:hypothetical protein